MSASKDGGIFVIIDDDYDCEEFRVLFDSRVYTDGLQVTQETEDDEINLYIKDYQIKALTGYLLRYLKDKELSGNE